MIAPFQLAYRTLRQVELSAPEGLVFYVDTYKNGLEEGFSLKIKNTNVVVIITSNKNNVINVVAQNRQVESFPPITDPAKAAVLVLDCIKFCVNVHRALG
jgi:hypothetical protein